MAKIYDSIESHIRSKHIASAAATLEENEQKVAAGAKIILPTLLAVMLKKGDTPEIEEVLKEGEKIKAWENYDEIWHGSGVHKHINLGERMENRLLSPHDPKFNTEVGHKAGLRTGHADRLTNWIAGTIAAWFASQMAGGKSYKSLLGELAGDKAELGKGIPADIMSLLGLEHLFGAAAAPKAAPATSHRTPVPAPKKSSLAWLWWLLGLILAALIVFFCVRSCSEKKKDVIEEVVEVKKEVVADPLAKFSSSMRILPDGTKIKMYSGHLESAIKSFLDSDRFKKATDTELRGEWFEFTDIDFEHNSATVFQTAADADRLKSLVNILKNYPGIKIKIGAFGDKTGTRAANYGISEARAELIRSTLVEAGFPATHISVEGFGKEFATIDTKATNAERAPDRDIAMRFSK